MAEKLATLSFDDGGEWDMRTINLLNGYRVPATFYIPSCQLLESNYRGLDNAKICFLYNAHEVGVHGMLHVRIKELTDARLVEETVRARSTMFRFFGSTQALECFSYPYGSHSQEQFWAFEQAGFKWVRTTHRGTAEGPSIKQHRYQQHVTEFLDESKHEEARLQAIMQKLPIHIAAHSYALEVKGLWPKLETTVQSLLDNGYTFVPNSTFFSRINQ